nr:CapA family protein [Bacillus sp. Marseille-P3661]
MISTVDKDISVPVKEYVEEVSIKISAAGDVTLGGDVEYGYQGSFNQEADDNGLTHFVKNIKDLFIDDDLTMVNLETTLTTATAKANKKFRFKGDPSYTEILTLGSIESVNLANNHTLDYLQQGYNDTIANLKKADIGYFGNDHQYVKEINGVKVGALGYKGWSDTSSLRKKINNDIAALRKKDVAIVMVHFHWGEERSYTPNTVQKSLGRYTIDSGADLVLGHHPHVVQGIEEYKGKFIVYSLGNFMFGGNRNPSDKDTFVFQQTFHVKDKKLTTKKDINVIPFSISSVSHRNNYQPTPMDSTNAAKLKQKLVRISENIGNSNWALYENNKAMTYE